MLRPTPNADRSRHWPVLFAAAIPLIVAGLAPGHLQAARPSQASGTRTSPPADQQAVLQRYCLTCHNQNMKERGAVPIALDRLRSPTSVETPRPGRRWFGRFAPV